ncbi:fibropellin-1 [Octopus bimaculoides]|nr:fibropellin-1 [Octopus bimaculoides]|eukprot:XP_014774039.1 PREDICTED: fibropellin-1-like [Octopus bimaculoides]
MMVKALHLLWLCLSTLVLFIPESNGSGQISIRFRSYANSGGKGSNGHCCDGRWIICGSACDHQFSVCLDRQHGNQDMGACPFGSRQSGEMTDQDSITFGTSIGGVKNPMLFKADSVPLFSKFLSLSLSLLMLSGWTSADCLASVDDCVSHKCENYATCVDKYLGYTCVCPKGYTGHFCETEILECLSDPCTNNGTCTDGRGTFHCNCTEGWAGITCESSINDCQPHPCQNNATCIDQHMGYLCECMDGWEGQDCEIDINECDSNPCVGSATCVDLQADFKCICATGYTGELCQVQINECLDSIDNPCEHNSTCHDTDGSYTCECVAGYTGQNCETNINECATGACQNGAICLDFVNDFKCVCVHGWTGPTCNERDLCLDNECSENATCIERHDQYECVCSIGWGGPLCDMKMIPCVLNACSNNGTCYQENPTLNSQGHFTCICPEDWTGPTCEIPMSLYLPSTPQPPGSNSAEIFLIGDIDAIDVSLVKRDLLDLLSHQVGLNKEHLDIDVALTKMTAEDDISVVRVLATASTDIPDVDTKLDNLQASWEEIPLYIVERDMTYPVYRGHFGTGDRNPENAPTENWAQSYWYIILLVVIVTMFVVFVVLVAIMILRRRAKKLCPIVNIGHPVPVSPDHSSTPRPESETELTPQPIRKGEQSFDNQLYMGYHFTSGIVPIQVRLPNQSTSPSQPESPEPYRSLKHGTKMSSFSCKARPAVAVNKSNNNDDG